MSLIPLEGHDTFETTTIQNQLLEYTNRVSHFYYFSIYSAIDLI